eukprot:CAMPEP_0113711284 /NCGR_PEP_ID=MMETSP0038_2-20120614/30667_1 /TAXON_ID=2898 /ORGANISM="Cryptomonas paramecium" /LENGTH=156 /DNA_ID=CAMNT_0000637515 /DNA_START=324 /DNA_END=790 /DNA_ORIENTATION=+ /assembly_acc=CAM_ASM_000170
MRALAELELRESEHHHELATQRSNRAKLFELFRKAMAEEVHAIHKLQRETSARHVDAFKNISANLLQAAANFRNYADLSLDKVNGDVTSFSAKQEEDFQKLLGHLADRSASVDRAAKDLHDQAAAKIAATQAYAARVAQEMRAGDEGLLRTVQDIS